MADLRAVIMAGGSGTRFWPLSRAGRAKQFLDIVSAKSMLEETVDRILPLFSPENIFTVAGSAQTKTIRKLLPGLPAGNTLVEPRARNTAPSLMLATARIYLDDPEAVVAALPADHLIRDGKRFLKKLRAGAEIAARGDRIVTFGIPPTYPATGYGYIHYRDKDPLTRRGEAFYDVLAFKEKPALAKARRFLAAGGHVWNSGIFLWRADVFAGKLKNHAPEMVPFWERMLTALKRRNRSALQSIFDDIPSISIDYALMEKARGVYVCRGDFGWSDVGAWSSLAEIWPADSSGNTSRGETMILDASGCLVYNPRKLTALVGVRDLVVVDAGDVLLICPRDRDQEVRDIVQALGKSNRTEYL